MLAIRNLDTRAVIRSIAAWLGSRSSAGLRRVLGSRLGSWTSIRLREGILAWLGSILTRLGRNRRLLATPLLNDRWQDSPAGMTGLEVDIRSRVWSSLKILIERPGVAGVEED